MTFDDLYRDETGTARPRLSRSASYDGKSTARRERSRSRDRATSKKNGESRDQKSKKKGPARSSSASQDSRRGDAVTTSRVADGPSRSYATQGPMAEFQFATGALPSNQYPPVSDYPSYSQPAASFRPALTSGGSFGEAAEFYNDQGQSVEHQPGVRPDAPSILMPANTPHLMTPSMVAKPPKETGSGAAAEFYGPGSSKPPRPAMPGGFDDGPLPAKPPGPGKPGKMPRPSASAAAAGAAMAAGLSHEHQYATQMGNTSGAEHSYGDVHGNSMALVPVHPPPGQEPLGSSHSHVPLYAAGAAGIAAAAYGAHHGSAHHHSFDAHGGHTHSDPFASGTVAMRRERRGPMTKLMDWWKDYDDVRKMEEYTEYIGVCRHCFDPRSSPSDAPRKHHYRRRRSSEFRPNGVSKESRYYTSDSDSRCKSSRSWVATGLAGYGLGKVGKALWNQRNDFNDTRSIKSGRAGRSRTSLAHSRSRSRSRSRGGEYHSEFMGSSRRRSRSRDHVIKLSSDRERKSHSFVRHRSSSRSRSRSPERKRPGLLTSAIASSAGGSAASKAHKRHRSRSPSPHKVVVRPGRRSGDHHYARVRPRRSSHGSVASSSVVDLSQSHRSQSGILGGFFEGPPRKTRTRRKKKKKGFFALGNASSSSSDSNLAFGAGYDRRRKVARRRSSEDKLNTALMGLGATAAALAATQNGRAKHANHRAEVGVVRGPRSHGERALVRRPHSPSVDEDDGEWESLPDDDASDSANYSSGLAFGSSDSETGSRKGRESLASEPGRNRWGWRWGRQRRSRPSLTSDEDVRISSNAGPAPPVIAPGAVSRPNESAMSSVSSVPTLQSVYAVPTSNPTNFDAATRSGMIYPQPSPTVTSRPENVTIQHPQPLSQVPGTIYTSLPPTQPGYSAPVGPPVFAQSPPRGQSKPVAPESTRSSATSQATRPLPLRRGNSSPVLSPRKKNPMLPAIATGIEAGVVAKSALSRRQSSPTNVRFDLTKEQAKKDRDRLKEEARRDEKKPPSKGEPGPHRGAVAK